MTRSDRCIPTQTVPLDTPDTHKGHHDMNVSYRSALCGYQVYPMGQAGSANPGTKVPLFSKEIEQFVGNK
jgi:hypothetical protein